MGQRRSYTFDPDGRVVSVQSSTFGTDQYTYNADGRETQYQEGTGGSTTSPEQLTYDYYPDGQRKALSISSSALTQTDEFIYDYRNDRARTKLVVAGYANAFSWSYSNAGRVLTQNDPLTGTTAPAQSLANAVTFVAQTAQYDSYGELSSLTLPNTGGYNNFSRDGEGNVLGASIVEPAEQLPQPSIDYQNGRGEMKLSRLGGRLQFRHQAA